MTWLSSSNGLVGRQVADNATERFCLKRVAGWSFVRRLRAAAPLGRSGTWPMTRRSRGGCVACCFFGGGDGRACGSWPGHFGAAHAKTGCIQQLPTPCSSLASRGQAPCVPPPPSPHDTSPDEPFQMSWNLLERFIESDHFNEDPSLSVAYLSCVIPSPIPQHAAPSRRRPPP